jgi:crotonobetainyl-CoA:carnitine CoA-transferase CaiB-like acyl-CoA transferase
MSIPTYRALQCADRDIVITANTPRMWLGLCRALDLPTLPDDPRFGTNEDRRSHREELAAFLEPAARRLTAAELLSRLAAEGVPAAPINTVDATLDDPQVRHRDMVLELQRGDATLRAVGDPLKISDGRRTHGTPPRLGQDTAHVLRTVAGLVEEEIEDLLAGGALIDPGRRSQQDRAARSAS